MTVKLYSRASGDLTPGVPPDIYSTFGTEEEALAQAVSDLLQANRTHSPQRIEGEDGGTLMDRPELEKAAQDAQTS